jgi:hypothetical protein
MTAAEKAQAHRNGMVGAVKDHAAAHYTEGAWDVVIEAMTDDEIWKVVKNCPKPSDGVRRMERHLSVYADVRAEHDAEAARGV